MTDFKGSDNLQLILLFIVPGLLALFARARFLTGRIPSVGENTLTFVALSLIYYSIALPVIGPIFELKEPWIARAAAWLGLVLVGPILFGIALGVGAQKRWATRLLGWLESKFGYQLGLNITHVIPTAWDWRFCSIPRGGIFAMVTLTSGERVAGLFGKNSFASSDSAERDLYMEQEYEVTEQGEWIVRRESVGILVPLREIRYVEFWEPRIEETVDG